MEAQITNHKAQITKLKAQVYDAVMFSLVSVRLSRNPFFSLIAFAFIYL